MECSARLEPFRAALNLTRPLAHVSTVGENPGATISPSDQIGRNGITLTGSTCFPLGGCAAIVGLFDRGLGAREPVTHRIPLKRGARRTGSSRRSRPGK